MKKNTLLFASLIMAMSFNAQTLTRIWEKSDSAFIKEATASFKKPIYFDGNCRGMAYGNFNGNERVFFTSRNGTYGNKVYVYDGITGDSIKALDMTEVTGGSFVLSDAGVTEDGVLLVCNDTHSGGGPFKIYKWDNENSVPTTVVSYSPTPMPRFGDRITVTGKVSDGTARIYAIAGIALTNYKVTYWGMEQIAGVWKFKQTPDELNTSITTVNSNFHQLTPGPDGGFYFRTVQQNNFMQIKADLTFSTGNTHPSSVIDQNSTVPVYIKTVGDYDYACYMQYGSLANQPKRIQVVKIDRALGITSATIVASSPSLGATSPGNGSGHIGVKVLQNGDVDIVGFLYQNGFAKYRLSGVSTSLSNIDNSHIKILKNGNSVLIEGINPSSIELFNTLGQKVISTSNTNELRTNNLKGVYIVQIKANGKIVKTEKISL